MVDRVSIETSIVHLNIVVYAMAYWLTQPVLPFLSKDLGADLKMFGYFQTTVSALQFIGAPIVGRLCDTKGPKSALLMSQFSALLIYTCLGCASSVRALFISQIPTTFLHCMHASQAYITLTSSSERRATSLGRLSLSYSIGMISGSYAGGRIADFSTGGYSTVSFVAAFISFLILLVTLLGLSREVVQKDDTPHSQSDWLRGFKLITRNAQLFRLIVLQLGIGLALMLFRTSLSQVLRTTYDSTAAEIGTFMSVSGGISVATNVLIIPYTTRTFNEERVIMFCVSVLLLIFMIIGFMTPDSRNHLMLLSVPMTVASSTVYTIFSSRMTKVVPSTDSGSAIGLSHAVRTLCGIIAPTVGGVLLQSYGGFTAIGLACAGICALILLYDCTSSSVKKSDKKTE